ncbi:MAG: response regulator [Pseudomonadales bacterium]|nr:response regulator [Pseudomonadales bacterium]
MNADRFLPQQLRQGSVETRRRARLVLYALLIASLAALLSASMMLYLGHRTTAFALLLVPFAHAAVYLLLQVSKSTRLSAHVFMGLIFLELTFDYGPDDGYGVLVTIALPLAAAALIGPRAGVVWTGIGVLWAAYLGPVVFRPDDIPPGLGLSAAIMTIVVGIGSAIIESIRARAVEEAAANEQRLQALRDSIQTFAENSFPGIVVTSERGIDYVSDGVREILGYSQEIFACQPLVNYIHPEDFALTLRKVTATPARGFRTELRLRHSDGRWVWYEVWGMPLGEAAHNDHWIFAARNIEEERRGRDRLVQAQRLEGIGVLAAGIAHDFNNLLTVIIGCADMMPESEGRRNILLASDRAVELTTALRAFARSVPAHTQVIDIVAVARKLEPLFRSLLSARIRFEIDAPADSLCVRLPSAQFDQVLLNLVTNAKEAMSSGGELRLTIESTVVGSELVELLEIDSGKYVRITLADTGAGMSDTTLEHAFDPFFSTKAPAAGSGLGLASSYGIVTQAGGAIDIESVIDVGTTVRVYLPEVSDDSAPDSAMTTVEPSAEMTTEAVASQPAQILVVEDDAALRTLAKLALTSAGFEVATAESGEAALPLVRMRPPDLVITDIVMPGLRGNELALRLRAERAELPILFVSGYSGTEIDDWTGWDAATTGFLAKPFRPAELIAQVNRLLERES